jgi:hypothetical protein
LPPEYIHIPKVVYNGTMKKAIVILAVLLNLIPVMAVQDYRKGDLSTGPLLPAELVISKELMGGHAAKHIVAKNTDVDITAEDLIDNGGTFTWATTAKRLNIIGTTAQDLGATKANSTLTVVDWNQMLGVKPTGTITVEDYTKLQRNVANGTISVADYTKFSGAKASRSFTISAFASIVNGTVLTINGQTFTENKNWFALSSNNGTAGSFANGLTLFGNGFTASHSGPIVTVSYTSNGFTGNTKSMNFSATTGITSANGTLAGGRPNLLLVVNGTTLTTGTTFLANGSNTATAKHIADAINGAVTLTEVNATWDNNLVRISTVLNGSAANSSTLSTNNNNGATVSGATFKNGRAPRTITVNGNVLTAYTKFTPAYSNDETAASIATAINAMNNGATFSATSSLNVVNVQYDSNGEAGNALTLATSDINGATVSASTLLGGEDLLTLTVNGKTFVAGTRFTPSTDNATTASAIVTMLNANGALANDLIATSSGRTITLRALTAGTAGNSITTSSNDADSITALAATLGGGKAASTGAQVVHISGLNGGYLETSEDVILNGTGLALTNNYYLRLNDFYVKSVGAINANNGAISAKQNGGYLLMGKIAARDNTWFSSTYTVPKGKSGYLVAYGYSFAQASPVTSADLEIKSRAYNGAFVTTKFDSLGNGTTFFTREVTLPVKFTERTDIYMKAGTSANNTAVTGQFDLIEAED